MALSVMFIACPTRLSARHSRSGNNRRRAPVRLELMPTIDYEKPDPAAIEEALAGAGLTGYDLVDAIKLLATQRDEARDNEANTMAQAGQFADERNESRSQLEAAQVEVTRLSRAGLDALDAMLSAGHRGRLVDNIHKLTAERNEARSELSKANSASAEQHVSALLAVCEQNPPEAIQRFIAAGCDRVDAVAPGFDRSAPGDVRTVNLRLVDVMRVHELISAHTLLSSARDQCPRDLSPAVVEDFERFRQVAAARDLLMVNGWIEDVPCEWWHGLGTVGETSSVIVNRKECSPEILRALAILAEEAQP
jgi:hypothetical protein